MRHGAQMPERRAVAELSRGLSTAFVDNRRELSGDTRTGLGSSGRVAPRVGAWVAWVETADGPVQAAFLRTAAGTGATATRSRNSLPDLKCGTYFPGTCTDSPDFGLRPKRGGR